ncbi:MAG: HD domain-containing protein [Baileyella intestinalis]|uniref:HD domain-containing protein n=1 Tax=Baileyella intestinalis TaxID=2606709 RepID=UPI002A752A06|nr:HD domain-containing protein [Baileyella intestinalis]MDY2995459.1 HD domain-containing protein [Baileyella intestinalis]
MSDKVAKAVSKMVTFYERESQVVVHDVNHFMKVWGFARTIGILEGLDPVTQETLELAAVAHDIACPLCRRKYGQADGRHQELEGEVLTRQFYEEFHLPEEQLERICYIVAHHHSFSGVQGLDYQIMLEADFLVNAGESEVSLDGILNFREKVFRTGTGIRLLNQMYGL